MVFNVQPDLGNSIADYCIALLDFIHRVTDLTMGDRAAYLHMIVEFKIHLYKLTRKPQVVKNILWESLTVH